MAARMNNLPQPSRTRWWNRRDVLCGALLYPAGDSAACLLLGEFSWLRALGVALVGSLLYSAEIPAWFRSIDRWSERAFGWSRGLLRSVLATIYFNPLWIARHLCFLTFLAGKRDQIDWNLLATGNKSFWASLLPCLVANHLIQNVVPTRLRFPASSTFTALMAVYYAVSQRWFS